MALTYPKHTGALAYARTQIGVNEVRSAENGWRSNRGPIQRSNPRGGVDYYQEHDFLAGVGYPWCVSFALTCWEQGARDALPYRTAGAYDMLNWARRVGWARSSKDCIPGDLIVWNIGSGHLSVLEGQNANMLTTIDGNSSNRVQRVNRSRVLVRGGVHIPEKPAGPVYVYEPFWVVTTSVNGQKRVVLSQFATRKRFLGMFARLALKYDRNGMTIRRGGTRKRRVN